MRKYIRIFTRNTHVWSEFSEDMVRSLDTRAKGLQKWCFVYVSYIKPVKSTPLENRMYTKS